jgi:hypothetical protein
MGHGPVGSSIQVHPSGSWAGEGTKLLERLFEVAYRNWKWYSLVVEC